MADELDVNKVFAGHDLTLNTVHTDYPPSCLPGKFKAPSTEKAKRALFEKIDEHLYEKAARMVAFRTSVVRLVPWIKSLQLLYYEYYGKSDSFDVDWKDEPKDWTENTSSEKKICIDLLDLSLSDNKLMYKLTVFINTGLIQVQGNRKDFFVRKHFPLLTQILAKILEVNKIKESSEQVSGAHQGSGHGELSKPEPEAHDDTCMSEQTMAKQVHASNDQSSTDVHNKQVQDSETPVTCTTDNESSVTKYNSDIYLEKIQNCFVSAIEKVCTQQSVLFDSKLKLIEENYNKSIQHNNENLKKLMDTIESNFKKPTQDTDKLYERIATLEKENVALKSSVKELQSNSTLHEECWRSKMETQEVHLKLQRQTQEKTIQNLQKEVESLQSRIAEKSERLSDMEASLQKASKSMEDKENELYNLKLTASHDQTDDFQQVKSKKKPNRDHNLVTIIGTSNTKGIDPSKLSTKYETIKKYAYTLMETEEMIDQMSEEDHPDVIVLHSLTNDVGNFSNEDCVHKMNNIVVKIFQRFKNIKIILSLPTPRADDEKLNNKAQILSLQLKDKFQDVENVTLCDNSNLAYKGRALQKFLAPKDNYHLSDSGVSMLAANIRDCIDQVLGLRHRFQLHTNDNSNSRNDNRNGQGNARNFNNYNSYQPQTYGRGRGYNNYRQYRGRGPQYRGQPYRK